ncbi:methyltransferase domain-containing protein [Mycena olivaceomarginata]|nr:methyltransferase domain-containing protein [Mycena olivaceomarginata]
MSAHPLLSAPSAEVKSNIASTYDAIATEYNAWTASHHGFRLQYLNRLVPQLSAIDNSRILELGAGAGDPGTVLLATLPAAHIIANDISGAQLSLLKARLAGRNLSGKSELDAVVGLYSILHLPREEQGELLRRVGSWVRAGGWLLVNFGGKESEGSVQMGWLESKEEGKESQNAMYWSSWSPEESKRLVEEAGFRIEVAEIGGKEGSDADFLWVLAQKVG